MKNKKLLLLLLLFLVGEGMCSLAAQNKTTIYKPWEHGSLQVSNENRYLKNADGTPFFWLGETGWLLPERLDRDEAGYYLNHCRLVGFNVVQVQTMNGVPSMNVYGQYSLVDGFNFKDINQKGNYGYWDHVDYIIDKAAQNGIYIAMVCIWGGLVRSGNMNIEEARAYGKFLGERYKNSPNIIWVIGGDTYADKDTDVWGALAKSIRAVDKNHLMTFHPFGRTSSATHLNSTDWLDFNMFQSGHRRYGQKRGDGDYSVTESTEEDNWRYVEDALSMTPLKPILDAEPSYEDIPQGLHDPKEPRWSASDVRRYAYWSVFAGSCGHTYGHNNIMQFVKPGVSGNYGADGAKKPWYEAMKDPGFNQMKHLKNLMLAFPYFERVPDQTVIAGTNGNRYDRSIATRGKDYLLVYNYSGRPVSIDLTKISGEKKKVWWYNPRDGKLSFISEFENKITTFAPDAAYHKGYDYVLIAMDSSKNYIASEETLKNN